MQITHYLIKGVLTMQSANHIGLIMNLVEDVYNNIISYYSGEVKPKIKYMCHPDGCMSIWTKLADNYCDFNLNWDEDNPGVITVSPVNIRVPFISKNSYRVYVDYSDNISDVVEQIEDIFQDYL